MLSLHEVLFLKAGYLVGLHVQARLANTHTLLEDEESARDNHVLACNFSTYSPIIIFFSLTD